MLYLLEKNEPLLVIGQIHFLAFCAYTAEDYNKSSFFFN
jgi:hypothetical protein